jgi:hypothetical protein
VTYFAMDGNYGSSHGLVVLDTSIWSQDEWSAVENATDENRIIVALDISMGE